MTTIALDPILSNIVFTLNLIMHLRAPASSSPYEKPSFSTDEIRVSRAEFFRRLGILSGKARKWKGLRSKYYSNMSFIRWHPKRRPEFLARMREIRLELLPPLEAEVERETEKMRRGNPSSNPWKGRQPLVSVLVPTFKERRESVLETTECLAAQTWKKLEVLFIIEPVEAASMLSGTIWSVEEAVTLLKRRDIDARVVVSDGKVKLKPHALNCGLREARGEIICVYDADDRFPESQIEEAVGLMLEKGYDVVQPKVFRSRENFGGRFLMLDAFVWQRKFLPTVHAWAGIFPLSGEGLFIRREALEEVGGFPEVLTEDAYLSILLAEREKKFGLLDSEVYELAPTNWRSHFRQRVRWFRGYLSCLGRMLKAKIPLKAKLTLYIPFLAPITCSFALITWTFLTIYWITWAYFPQLEYIAPWMLHWLYSNAIFYWSAFLAYIGNPIVVFSLMHSLAGTRMERSAPLALMVPLYWIFIGAAAIASFFRSTKFWGKTER